LRSALREDPDIILVGEMRDLETIRLAMTAAETGHLCSAPCIRPLRENHRSYYRRISRGGKRHGQSHAFRIIAGGYFSTYAEENRRRNVCGDEIMVGTAAIRNLIREAKVAQIILRFKPAARTACRRWIRI